MQTAWSRGLSDTELLYERGPLLLEDILEDSLRSDNPNTDPTLLKEAARLFMDLLHEVVYPGPQGR